MRRYFWFLAGLCSQSQADLSFTNLDWDAVASSEAFEVTTVPRGCECSEKEGTYVVEHSIVLTVIGTKFASSSSAHASAILLQANAILTAAATRRYEFLTLKISHSTSAPRSTFSLPAKPGNVFQKEQKPPLYNIVQSRPQCK